MRDMLEIRRRIRAVEQTRKITNAMYLISSAKVKKLVTHMAYNKLYVDNMHSAMQDTLRALEDINHPYLRDRGDKRKAYIVIAGEKGMAGAYNADVLKFALPHVKTGDYLITVGQNAGQFFKKQGVFPDVQIRESAQEPIIREPRHIIQDVFRLYDEDLVDQVYVIYTKFISTVKSFPCMERLLPLATVPATQNTYQQEMLYHPSPREMFHLMVPQYTVGILYGALMQAYAAEHCARMNAMQSATRNADEMLKKFKVQYNLARQAAITQEINEITSAAQALQEKEPEYGQC